MLTANGTTYVKAIGRICPGSGPMRMAPPQSPFRQSRTPEEPCRVDGGPLACDDRLHLPVVGHDPFDDDPTEFLPPNGRSDRDRVWQPENPSAVGVEGPDAVVIGQRSNGRPDLVPFGEIGSIG